MVGMMAAETRRGSLGTPRKIFGEVNTNIPRIKESTVLPQKKISHREEPTDGKHRIGEDVGQDSVCDLSDDDEKKMAFKKVCEYRVGEDVDDTLCELGIQEWSVDDFDFVKRLGKGGSGTVFLATEKQSGYKVALKVQESGDNAILELDLHESLNHPNIVKMYDYFYSTQFFEPSDNETNDDLVEKQIYLYMVLELCEGGSLYEGIIDNACDIDDVEEQVAIYFLGALNATEYLHNKGIIHCDFKSDNVLIHKNTVKVADFGMAVYNEEKEIVGGSKQYMSPEHLMAWRHMTDKFDHRTDIYSLGVILYEMLFGYLPYKVLKEDYDDEDQCEDNYADEEEDLDAYIDEGYPILDLRTLNDYTSDEPFYIPPPIFTEGISDEAIDLVSRLMEPSVEKRISLAEAKEHPWLKQYV
mmetsp:Transcript_28737/g.43841  ORF Transcript_28737/g.43841 Transcript_28737/m.43841 type:complete len:413 (-) Transcript_28737:65-1303(-)